MRTATTVLAFMVLTAMAYAFPPPNADPTLSPWYQSLLVPGSGISCCGISDCGPVPYRIIGEHYEAFISEEWRVVPPDKVIKRSDNPTGSAVACWTPTSGVMCFVIAPQT